MKKIAFTCSTCDTLNVPAPGDHWRGLVTCSVCDSLESVATNSDERTTPHLYRKFSANCGLSVAMVFEL